jgi:antitoxin ParD1/3/4
MPMMVDHASRRRWPVPTRNVVLTDRQEDLIQTLVRSGRYQNASEVLREGLRLVEWREAEEAAKLEALRAAARRGAAAFDRGDFTEFRDADAMIAHLESVAEQVRGRARDE